LNILWKLWK